MSGHHPICSGNLTKRHRESEFTFYLSWEIDFLLSDISAPGSWAFGLGLGLIPMVPLILRPLDEA